MEMNLFTDKNILITGSTKGLGRALAVKFAERGATVIEHYYTSKNEAEEFLQELKKFNSKCGMFQANLRSPGQTTKMMEKIHEEYGHIDILINNVGNFIYKQFDKVTFEEFADVIETNLYSSFLCGKLVIEKMKERKSGHIINIGCAGADRIIIRELTTPYYIAKTGVLMLTKILAHAYAPYGIRVNAVSPGILETSVAKLEVPAGRLATFDDIFNAISFLLSPQSEYINGANIEVAGAWLP
jgi:NAD(P)-dependent dehydrogenase (short-subunit alcohol dehydrogenase family)